MLVLMHGNKKVDMYATQCPYCRCKFAMTGKEVDKAADSFRSPDGTTFTNGYKIECPDCHRVYTRGMGELDCVLIPAGKETDRSSILFALREKSEAEGNQPTA